MTMNGQAAAGVLRESYSIFWDDLLAQKSTGDSEFTIPISPHFSCEDYESIGRMITHQFVQCASFPVRISQASIQQAVVGDVTDECLITSFLNLLPPREKELVDKAIRGNKPFPTDELMDIFEDHNINVVPSPENLKSLVVQVARNEFVTKPYLCLLNIRKGMGSLWDNVSAEQIASIYGICLPTAQRIIDCMYMVPKDSKEEQIFSWLKRYLRGASHEILTNFVRFCTATDVILPHTSIAVHQEVMPSAAIRPKSQTCFRILILPKNYESFVQLRKNLELYLRDSSFWDLND